MTRVRAAGPIVLLANGNLNGRVIRLIADELHRRHLGRVRVIATTTSNPLSPWPDERTHPHVVGAEQVEWREAEQLVREASVFVLAPSWDGSARRLVGVARRAGTPVVCVVADVGYGARKLDVADRSERADRICVADPITKELLLRNGIPASTICNAGSPYLDSILAAAPLPPPPGGALRVAVLANPNGTRERLSDRCEVSPEGVLPALCAALNALAVPEYRVTIRLHPRQKADRIPEWLPLPEAATFDPFPSTSTFPDFLSEHHLVVGSYSMGLMVARVLGRPAVSFQPRQADDGLRREIFAAWDVPVATDDAELAVLIAERLRCPGLPFDPGEVLYEPGRSLDALTRVILDAVSMRTAAGEATA
jgi:hypothetical protein